MENRVLFGVLTLLLNAIGVPCFMVGKKKAGIIRIVLYCLTCGIVACINGIYGIIQGIKILRMTDEEYAAIEDKATLIAGIPAIKD